MIYHRRFCLPRLTMFKRRQQHWLAMCLLSASACVSTHAPRPARTPDSRPEERPTAQPVISGRSQWTIRYSEQTISYRVTRKAVIQSSDSTLQRESSENVTHERVTLASLSDDSTKFKV